MEILQVTHFLFQPNFNFGGIYCGSSNCIDFQLTNKESTKAFVDFDFNQFRDFAISIPNMTVYQGL